MSYTLHRSENAHLLQASLPSHQPFKDAEHSSLMGLLKTDSGLAWAQRLQCADSCPRQFQTFSFPLKCPTPILPSALPANGGSFLSLSKLERISIGYYHLYPFNCVLISWLFSCFYIFLIPRLTHFKNLTSTFLSSFFTLSIFPSLLDHSNSIQIYFSHI